ncbi:MAG: peptidase S9, partial [Bacteroidetes bacterium HGW-Bacteroidetes-22]
MIKNNLFILSALLVLSSCANQPKDKSVSDNQQIIGPKTLDVTDGRLTPEILWALGRVSEPRLSPDKNTVLYGVTWYDVVQNKGNRELYTIGIDGAGFKQLTATAKGEYDAQWRPDGKRIGFMTAESGSMQIWEMNPDGSDRKQVSRVDGGITGFRYSPDQTKLFFTAEVAAQKPLRNLFGGLDKTSGRLMDEMMYRHWDTWVDSYSHIFIGDYQNEELSNVKDIMEGEQWDAPVKPNGGTEQIAWSPDNKTLVYACRKLTGKAYTLSTNSDLFAYDLASGRTSNLTEGMPGYDLNPVFSPDGRYLAWESMERDGYEADQIRLFLLDIAQGTKTYLTEGWDNDVHNLTWDNESNGLWFTAPVEACEQVCFISVNDKKVRVLTNGVNDYVTIALSGNGLIAGRMSMSEPVELYRVNTENGEAAAITATNKELLSKLNFGKPVKRWVKTSDNKQMLTWVILPPDFDSTKKYPTLLYCQGGPQSTVSQFWSYRWNFQMMVANGYVVVAPNRHGVPGFGKAWNEQISGDYGGQNMKDYLAAIDDVSKESWSDESRLG